MSILNNVAKDKVTVELSGNLLIKGLIVARSHEILVIFNGTDFMYLPLDHIKRIFASNDGEEDLNEPTDSSSKIEGSLTFESILEQAKSFSVEIVVAGKESLHGSIVNIMQDYFIFHSPIYKTMYIAKQHLKWLIPYPLNMLPYGREINSLEPTNLKPTFAAQLEAMKNKILVFNQGEKTYHIGKIHAMDGGMIELEEAKKQVSFINLAHVKTVWGVD